MTPDDVAVVPDPIERAIVSREAYTLHWEIAMEMARVRREAVVEAHKAGMTYKQIGAKLGITVPAVEALFAKGTRPPTPRWWERVPAELAAEVKRGPGGTILQENVANVDVLNALVKAMRVTSRSTVTTYSPAELVPKVEKRLKREVPKSAIRVALQRGIEQGSIIRVGWARYGVREAQPAEA